MASRPSGSMKAKLCQTWIMSGQIWSWTAVPAAPARPASRTASSSNISAEPTGRRDRATEGRVGTPLRGAGDIYVTRSMTAAAHPGFARCRPVSSSGRIQCLRMSRGRGSDRDREGGHEEAPPPHQAIPDLPGDRMWLGSSACLSRAFNWRLLSPYCCATRSIVLTPVR